MKGEGTAKTVAAKKGCREREKSAVRHMIELYCRRHEGNVHPCGEYRGRDGNLCDECRRLLEYAERRLDACRYGDAKPVCRKCPTHCYRPDHRAKIREVMRYAGPRLILHHPMEAITHILRGWRGS